MRVLITGGFGVLGRLIQQELVDRGREVICLDLDTPANREAARENPQLLRVVFGDLRDRRLVRNAMDGVDAVIHLAAIIPPMSELMPDRSREVNVGATELLVELIAASARPPLLLYASSFAAHGHGQPDVQSESLSDGLPPGSNYAAHKIACERAIHTLESPWSILRVAGLVPLGNQSRSLANVRLGLSLAAHNRMEGIWPQDAALAFANALERPQAHGRVNMIGGGPTWQVHHIDFVNLVSESLGLKFEPEDFGTGEINADWVDTRESQQLLDFQRRDFDDVKRELMGKHRVLRRLVGPASPLIRKGLRAFLRH